MELLSTQAEPFSRDLAGHSAPIERIRKIIRKLARSDSPVLLVGETGTGKEVVARAIHAERDAAAPFIPVDCSVLGALLESELFGHTRGAFTGAVAAKRGLLEMADGGTAFFDEVGELPPDAQSKILRVLQEKEIRPLGGLTGRRSSFRVLAATNRDLAREAEAGRFRRDLYYRLNVVTVRMPPLRERKEDIPELADLFLRRYGRNHQLSPEVLNALLSHEWPGNVRELENCIQRLVALNSGPVVHSADLPTALQGAMDARRWAERTTPASGFGNCASAEPAAIEVAPTVSSLEEYERRAIVEALSMARGDCARAALILGMGRTTIYRKIKQYRLCRQNPTRQERRG